MVIVPSLTLNSEVFCAHGLFSSLEYKFFWHILSSEKKKKQEKKLFRNTSSIAQSFLYPCLEAYSFSELSINDVFPLWLIERVLLYAWVSFIKRFLHKIIHVTKLKYCTSPWFIKNGSRISLKRVTPHFHSFVAWVFKGFILSSIVWFLGFNL